MMEPVGLWILTPSTEGSFPIHFAEVSDQVHYIARNKGFWDCFLGSGQPEILATKIALMHSELSEALEEIRKTGVSIQERDEKIAEEFADVIIRIMDTASYMGIQDRLGAVIVEKSRKNAGRPHMHGKAF